MYRQRKVCHSGAETAPAAAIIAKICSGQGFFKCLGGQRLAGVDQFPVFIGEQNKRIVQKIHVCQLCIKMTGRQI